MTRTHPSNRDDAGRDLPATAARPGSALAWAASQQWPAARNIALQARAVAAPARALTEQVRRQVARSGLATRKDLGR
ncbi:hypothetical protein [Methylobacterium sp. CCH5-D2]|uniref:hypothetical protein n=1 Tax=Methylobacterium sp. CCH5-D2 TaxID=1768765 RepID=UPI000ADFCE5B|nr:hypothetical protein [Methylobacterium sp. CCH5-D2]